MTEVFLGLGSNIDREPNIRRGLDALAADFGTLALSSVYASAAVGFDGDPFYNLVVRIDTALSVGALHEHLRALEYAMGREPGCERFSPRTVDIDILTYAACIGVVDGVVLPRPEIVENAYVLRPLAELAPQRYHPELRCSYAELWQRHDAASQPLQEIAFHWSDPALARKGVRP
jgi:2-amino-4-hydroxy-6-hydroxymethyldihydropteridine diphosphokinase